MGVGVQLAALVGVDLVGIFLQVVHHGVAHGVAEGGLFPHENFLGEVVPLEGPAEQVFALAVVVALDLRVNGHDVLDEIQIPEGDPGFQGVDGNAPVSPEHVVGVELPDPLGGLFLEGLGGGGEVGVLVAEELVGDLAGEDHPDVRLGVDGLAHQVHADGGPDGGDVPGAQQADHLRQGLDHVVPGDDDLGVVGVEILGHLAGIFQVDGVLVHADGEGADGLVQDAGGHGAHQGAVQTAAEEEAQGGVRVQPLGDGGGELFPDVGADGVQVVVADRLHLGHVPVADELALVVIVSRRERPDLFHQTQQVFGFAGKENIPTAVMAVVQGADADGVPGGDVLSLGSVVEDQGKLCVQHPEHIQTVELIQGQQNLAVRVADKGVALLFQLPAHGPEAVDLPVAHQGIFPPGEGLHPLGLQAHDGQAVKAHPALAGLGGLGYVGAAGFGAGKALVKIFLGKGTAGIRHNRTHRDSSFFILR